MNEQKCKICETRRRLHGFIWQHTIPLESLMNKSQVEKETLKKLKWVNQCIIIDFVLGYSSS